MRRILLITLIIFSTGLYAQRKAGGLAIQSKFGLMEGRGQMNNLWGAFPEGQATSFSLGVNRLQGNKGTMFEANFFVNDYFVDKDNFNLPYRLYGLNVLGGWSYEKIRKFYINLKVGGFAGIQNVNNGSQQETESGATYANSVKGLTYGILATPEIEVVLYNKISLLASYTQHWHPSNKWTRFQYSIDLGLKYYL